MEESEITQTITRYLGKHHENLAGALPDEGYFIIRGATISERSSRDSRVTFGTAIDILADIIEKNNYFGWHVTAEVGQATHPDNAEILPLKVGDQVIIKCKLEVTEKGLHAPIEKVKPKEYLNILRTSEGFIHTAKVLGIEGYLETGYLDMIASELYTS